MRALLRFWWPSFATAIWIAAALLIVAHLCDRARAQVNFLGITAVPIAGYQQLTVTNSAVVSLTVPAGARYALITSETAAIRWRDDGTAPTASSGNPIVTNGTLWYLGTLSAFQMIAQTGTSATVDVAYYR